MRVGVLALIAFAADCWAHPGHGAPVAHVHSWDWGHLLFGLAVVLVAALAVWKVK